MTNSIKFFSGDRLVGILSFALLEKDTGSEEVGHHSLSENDTSERPSEEQSVKPTKDPRDMLAELL